MGTTHAIRLANYAETYKANPEGNKLLRCPSCGRRSFKPYIFDDTKEAVDINECGICNHRSSCGYHFTPREYYKAHPERNPKNGMTKEELREEWKKRQELLRRERQKKEIEDISLLLGDFSHLMAEEEEKSSHPWEMVERSEERAEKTPFFSFLCRHFEPERVREVFRLYHVGGDTLGRVLFWQIDTEGRARGGKLIKIGSDGHRAKGPDGKSAPGSITWVHAILKKANKLPEGWKFEPCLFGAHLLSSKDMPAPVCLVEAEKSAIIGACAMPQYIWVATAGKENLNSKILAPLFPYSQKNGPVTIFPDVDAHEEWEFELAFMGRYFRYILSDYVREKAKGNAKAQKADIADYLTGEF